MSNVAKRRQICNKKFLSATINPDCKIPLKRSNKELSLKICLKRGGEAC